MVKSGNTSFSDKKRTGRPRMTRTPAKTKEARALIEANLLMSMRRLSRELEVPEKIMRELLKEDLGMKSLVKIRVQMLTALQCQK